MTPLTRKPTAQRRDEIVLAVLRIIGEQGLTSLSTTTLAEEVGVTTGALFRHFPSREAILEGTVDYALTRIDETFPDETLPPLERLRELAARRVRLLGANPGLSWLLRSEQAYLTLPPECAAHLRDAVRRSKRFLLDAIREGAARGDIRDDIEPEVLLVPVMGTIHALIGMPGVHRPAARARRPDADHIFLALLKMLAPPSTDQRTRKR
ncbi:MAG: TetR/AcrR family transcriptional regulator [Planctomycetes bacterium]|nr:TetR/AcrR family transcriptional regulator [Planctomycetota bacterium]